MRTDEDLPVTSSMRTDEDLPVDVPHYTYPTPLPTPSPYLDRPIGFPTLPHCLPRPITYPAHDPAPSRWTAGAVAARPRRRILTWRHSYGTFRLFRGDRPAALPRSAAPPQAARLR